MLNTLFLFVFYTFVLQSSFCVFHLMQSGANLLLLTIVIVSIYFIKVFASSFFGLTQFFCFVTLGCLYICIVQNAKEELFIDFSFSYQANNVLYITFLTRMSKNIPIYMPALIAKPGDGRTRRVARVLMLISCSQYNPPTCLCDIYYRSLL